uniref:Uncharacterized protein n=1 Tax=Romanomermis culicivorax TaxID=13658 RepID=A0A915I5A9_ROMCU
MDRFKQHIIHRKIDIEISDRRIPNMFNKYPLYALNPALTQETKEMQDAYITADICNTIFAHSSYGSR